MRRPIEFARAPGVTALPALPAWVALIGVLAASGCSSVPLAPELDAAQRLERQGHDEEALAAWLRLLARCPALADDTPTVAPRREHQRPGFGGSRVRDDCGLAAVRKAQLLEHLGRDAEAADAWEDVPRRAHDPRHAARGLARAAEIALDRLADPARAVRLAARCIDRYPDEVPSDDALAALVKVERERDAAALRARLDALADRNSKTDLGDNLLFAAGEISAAELHDAPGAVARWDQLAARYPHSGLRDDALWRGANLLRQAGDPRGAIDRLHELVAGKRKAWITGSYNDLYMDDAQLLLGRIYLDDLHDAPHAIEAFTRFVDVYTDSILRDDALFERARAHLAAHAPPTPADRAAACADWARLLRQFPDGNQARAAADRYEELGCGPEAGSPKSP